MNLNLRAYHDGNKERIEALITSKMKGEVAQVERGEAEEACCQEHDGSTEGDGGRHEVTSRRIGLYQTKNGSMHI